MDRHAPSRCGGKLPPHRFGWGRIDRPHADLVPRSEYLKAVPRSCLGSVAMTLAVITENTLFTRNAASVLSLSVWGWHFTFRSLTLTMWRIRGWEMRLRRISRHVLALGTAVVLSALSGCGAAEPVEEQALAASAEVEASLTPASTGTSASTATQTPGATPDSEPRPVGVPEDVQVAMVERIVDGDTIWAQPTGPGPLAQDASHNIRLLELDTPETKHPDKGEECWGPEATAFAEERLPVGSTIYLQVDQEDTDRYGRFLRYAWTQDGVFFNELAVRHGHGRAALHEPNDLHIGAMLAAEAEARSQERGLWGRSCDYDGTLATPEQASAVPEPEPAPEEPARQPESGSDCAPGYEPCIPPYPPDLDCSDLRGPIRVTGSDPHGLDGDGNGVGCEG